MPRVSVGLAVFVGGVVSVEAFLGGMFVQRTLLGAAAEQNTATPLSGGSAADTTGADSTSGARLARLEHEISALRAQVNDGLIRDLDVTITESKTAYQLVEPKLMISVDALVGGPVLAHFGTRTHLFMVGQRVDFRVKDCFCHLLLRESVRDRAVFHFGCERGDPNLDPLTIAPKDPVQDATRYSPDNAGWPRKAGLPRTQFTRQPHQPLPFFAS